MRWKLEDFIMIPLLVGAVAGLIWYSYSQRPQTPIEWQRQDMAVYGPTYTTVMANDGCYWRIYLRQGRSQHSRKDILPDGAGGKENCPLIN